MKNSRRLTALALIALLALASGPPTDAQTPTDCQMITTRWSDYVTPLVPSSGLSGTNLVVETSDVSGPPNLPGLWNPTMTAGAWNAAALGQVFGIALDDATPANAYVAATTCYGNFPGDPNQFGPGGSGAIYRIDGVTGAVTTLITLPNNGPGLGNISYAPGLGGGGGGGASGVLFAANLDDGQLYSIAINHPLPATIIAQRPLFSTNSPHALGSFAPLGERPYAVCYYPGEQRLYFSVWQGHMFTMVPWPQAAITDGATGPAKNSVWSIAIDPAGNFVGNPTPEIYVDHLPGQTYSNPVTDIAMSHCEVEMLMLAERTFFGDYGLIEEGHHARVLKYTGFTPGLWNLAPQNYYTGSLYSGPIPMNASGGVDLDTAQNVYATADLIGPAAYGVQRIPVAGNTVSTSLSSSHLIGFPGAVKSGMGDVEYHRSDMCDCDAGTEPCDRQDITYILNTGWDQKTSTLIPVGQTDDDWEVVRDEDLVGNGANAPHSNTSEPRPGQALAAPTNAWAPPGSLIGGEQSTWLFANNTLASTWTTYQYCFCLRSGFTNPILNLAVLGDDEAEVYLNGFFVGTTGTPGFTAPTSFVVVDPSVFMAGQNCLEVRVRNDISFAGINVAGTMTAAGARCCCTAPPRGLVGWWPMDGISATTAPDLLLQNDGSLVGPNYELGRVGSSLRFDQPDRVQVLNPSATLVNLQKFSIDAWIKMDCELPCPLPEDAPIANRKQSPGGPGFEFFVGAGTGYLGGRCVGSLGTVQVFQTSGPSVLDNEWHLAVMTFDGAGTVELWLDGLKVASGTTPTGSIVAPFPQVWFGGFDTGSQVNSFQGWIDEVEIFDRVLTPREIRSLNDAPVGKCRDYCYVPAVLPDNGGAVNIPVKICNTTGSPVTYSVDMIPASNCSQPGPTPTTSLPIQVTVPPGCTTTTTIAATLAPGSGDSCYTICVTNGNTGGTSCCPGLVRVGPSVDVVINDPNDGPFKPGFARTIEFEFHNTTLQQVDASYVIEVFPIPRDGGNGLVRLDGLPPGEPVRREVGLPPESLGSVNVQVQLDRDNYTHFHDLIFSADFDGDGVREQVASFTIEAAPPQPTLRAAEVVVPAPDFSSVDVLASASAPIDALEFAVSYDATVIQLLDADTTGTALALAGLDFYMPEILPDAIVVRAILTNSLTPGFEHTLVSLLGMSVAASLPATSPITFVDGTFGTPAASSELELAGSLSNADNGLLVVDGSVTLEALVQTFVRSDCNDDGGTDIADTIFLLSFLFGGGMTPNCADACDVNDDGGRDIADAVYTLSYLFGNGADPAAPFPACDVDPTADALDCVSALACP